MPGLYLSILDPGIAQAPVVDRAPGIPGLRCIRESGVLGTRVYPGPGCTWHPLHSEPSQTVVPQSKYQEHRPDSPQTFLQHNKIDNPENESQRTAKVSAQSLG